uniref:Uncharacterized protein n=1 Tax=Physcomitrium patens TaxID=3218 RepID=A0A2K1IGK8_PHYPA|nr:hypothetical protein PHYPA_029003 [Physcomitrium patens]
MTKTYPKNRQNTTPSPQTSHDRDNPRTLHRMKARNTDQETASYKIGNKHTYVHTHTHTHTRTLNSQHHTPDPLHTTNHQFYHPTPPDPRKHNHVNSRTPHNPRQTLITSNNAPRNSVPPPPMAPYPP